MVLQQVSSRETSPLLKGRICSRRLAEGFPLIMGGLTGLWLLCTLCDATRKEPYSSTELRALQVKLWVLLHTCMFY